MRAKISPCTRSLMAFVVIVGLVLVSPSRMAAQSGDKGVYNSNNVVTESTVWVDASAWWVPTKSQPWPDLCLILQQNILTYNYNTNYSNGTVIDARGLAYGVSGGTQIGCSVDPFGSLQGPPPSTTILLPSGNIKIYQTWTIPNNTRLVGDEQQTAIIAADPNAQQQEYFRETLIKLSAFHSRSS